VDAWGGCDLVVFLAGAYTPARAGALDAEVIRRTVDTNLTATMRGVACVLPALLERGAGGVAIVASVAGYGGLPQACIYGPTKAALINFAETLYLDVADHGVDVYLINPGFVETPLTAGNDFEMPALMRPAEAAQAIIDGFARGAFEIHFPKRFSRVLKALQWLPHGAYFRLIKRVTGL
jgi:NAD(P)-dependent dehydrogenase (short-subunit alcohol dehydrogenase family)